MEIHGYHLDLEIRDERVTLTMAGDLDAAATSALRGLLTCVFAVPHVVHVDTGGVLGADLGAFDPLLEAATARRARGLPGMCIESLSEAVGDLFRVLRISTRPPIELGLA